MEAQIFKALGDPLRLKIVKRLSGGSAYTIGDLTAGLGISRQGVRKQIQVLVDSRVVNLKPVGREVKVTLNAKSLEQAREYISHLESLWDMRLKNLKALVEGDSF
jgi:DNA-binding transcriptional ArsR family regulator